MQPDPTKLADLCEAAQAVIDGAARTYKARNGRTCSIESDDGELCLIVHSDLLSALEAALANIVVPQAMPQAHSAYPHITRLTLDMVGYNGGLHCLRTPDIGAEQDVKNLLDECLGAEGVYHERLVALDAWLGNLTEAEFMTVADGEEGEVARILARGPLMGDPEDTAADLINSIYEHCI